MRTLLVLYLIFGMQRSSVAVEQLRYRQVPFATRHVQSGVAILDNNMNT